MLGDPTNMRDLKGSCTYIAYALLLNCIRPSSDLMTGGENRYLYYVPVPLGGF